MWTGVRWPVAVAATATDILNCGDGDQGGPFSLVVRPSAYNHRTHSIWHPAKKAGQCYNLKECTDAANKLLTPPYGGRMYPESKKHTCPVWYNTSENTT